MPVATLTSVDEYLSSTYDPDCEFIDGEVVERNMGESDHSALQGLLFGWLFSRRKELGIHVFPELRVQITPARFRIPDITVTTKKISGRILREPPFLCIEVLSPEDRAVRLESKINDYLNFGVPHIWVVDPANKCAWTFDQTGQRQPATILSATNPTIEISVRDLFTDLAREVD